MSVASPVIASIDGTVSPRLIYLLPGVRSYHPIDDIYKEVRHLRRTNESLRRYDVFVGAEGNVPKNVLGTKRTPRFAFFFNTKVVPEDADQTLEVTGEQLYVEDNGDVTGEGADCMEFSPLSAGTKIVVEYAPSETETTVVSTGSGLSVEQDAALTRIGELLEADERFTPTQATKYRKGTTDVLLQKNVNGGDLTGTVTIDE